MSIILPAYSKLQKNKPTVGDVHVNRPLTSISIAYLQAASNYVCNQVFPLVPVDNRSDVYFTYSKADFRRNNLVKRPPATESAGGRYGVDSAQQYTCHVYGWHGDVSDQERSNYDNPLNPDADTTEHNMQTIMIGKEAEWASKYWTTGLWGTDKVGATDFVKWDDAASDPEADIQLGVRTIVQSTGMEPNTLVVNLATHHALKRHPLVQERFKYTSADSITPQMLARFFEIERYIIGKASYNSAKEGATESNAMLLGNNALLAYVAPRPSLKLPSAGYTFIWSAMNGSQGVGVRTKKFRMEHLAADRIETEMAFDQKLVSSDCGYFFSNTVA